jgi:hypothetical protein
MLHDVLSLGSSLICELRHFEAVEARFLRAPFSASVDFMVLVPKLVPHQAGHGACELREETTSWSVLLWMTEKRNSVMASLQKRPWIGRPEALGGMETFR